MTIISFLIFFFAGCLIGGAAIAFFTHRYVERLEAELDTCTTALLEYQTELFRLQFKEAVNVETMVLP